MKTGGDSSAGSLEQETLEVLRSAIARVVAQRERLKVEMAAWYNDHPQHPFPRARELIALDEELSGLDDRFKGLWDATHQS
nr:hypothetical protein EC580_05075 [Acidithiobacillus sulfuriphilus]